MSVPGSKSETNAFDKSSGQNPMKSGEPASAEAGEDDDATPKPALRRRELGGPDGPDPTRYGDWERKGRCIDF